MKYTLIVTRRDPVSAQPTKTDIYFVDGDSPEDAATKIYANNFQPYGSVKVYATSNEPVAEFTFSQVTRTEIKEILE